MYITQKKVKTYIKEKGWSIITAAEKSGLPAATIKSIIYGKSPNQKISTLEKLAKAFDCQVSDLITDDEVKQSSNEQIDRVLFKECLSAVELYLAQNNLNYSKQKIMKIIDSLFSLFIRKKKDNNPYVIDNATIAWIIDNLS